MALELHSECVVEPDLRTPGTATLSLVVSVKGRFTTTLKTIWGGYSEADRERLGFVVERIWGDPDAVESTDGFTFVRSERISVNAPPGYGQRLHLRNSGPPVAVEAHHPRFRLEERAGGHAFIARAESSGGGGPLAIVETDEEFAVFVRADILDALAGPAERRLGFLAYSINATRDLIGVHRVLVDLPAGAFIA